MRSPSPPEWFCTGWWSPWCVVDEYLHRIFAPAHPGGGIDLLPWPLSWVCDKHEAVLLRSVGEDPKPYLEEDRRRRREIRRRARRLRKYH